MVNDTWLLMQLYWKLDRREVTTQSTLRVLVTILGFLGFLFISAASAAFGYGASFLARPDVPIGIGPGLVPGLILTFVMIGVLATGLNQAMRALFLSGDLDRLMVAPIHTRSVMVAKLLSRVPSNLIILLLAAAPAFVAYGIGLGAGPVYYTLGVVLLLLAPLFGLAVGALLATLLVTWLPVKRLNELMAASFAVVGIGVALAFQIPRLYLDDDGFDSVSAGSIRALADRIEALPIPTFWAGRGLMSLDAGRFDGPGLLGIGAYLVITLGLFAGIILAADRLYMAGWLKTQSAGGKRRGLESAGGAFGRGSLSGAIGWKDWLMRLRDPRQLVNLLGGGFIGLVVGALAIFRGSGGDDSLMTAATQGDLTMPGPFAGLSAGFSPGVLVAVWALFVAFAFLSNTATYALALEGGAFPLLKAAPVRPRDVWTAKLWSVFMPFSALFVAVLLGGWFVARFSLLWTPYAVAAGLIYGYGLMTAAVSVGFRYANLSWTDPRRMVTSGGGLVSLLLTVVYGLPGGIVILLGFALAAVWPSWAIPLAMSALLLLSLLTWAWYLGMGRWAEKAWEKLAV